MNTGEVIIVLQDKGTGDLGSPAPPPTPPPPPESGVFDDSFDPTFS